MAGGYVIDPASGLPAMQSASGALIPLPLTPDDMALAGAQLAGPPGLPPPPPMGPDQRTAALSAGDLKGLGAPKLIRSEDAATVGSDGYPRIQLGGPAPQFRLPSSANEGALPPPAADPFALGVSDGPGMRTPTREQVVSDARRAAGLVSPADAGELAQHRAAPAGGQAPGQAQAGGRGIDPLTQQVFEDELRRGAGGGGPRRLGLTSETQKLTRPEAPMDPVLGARANQAQLASDAYGEQLATSLTERHQQAYEAQQGEFAARAGQMQAQQERQVQQQSMLQEYQAKRDALVSEAAQMKVPEMEEYWRSKGTMATMATALSIALGGALQGLRGGQNPGLEMSNQAIDRWIGEQREAYSRKRGEVADADNQYGRMVQTFGSENLAIEHLREQAWTVRDNMLKAYAEKIGTPTALENYNQAMLQTEAERAALQARASQGAMVEIEQKLAMQGGGGGRPSLAKALSVAAGAEKDRRVLTGEDQKPDGAQRAITSETTTAIGGALSAIRAARQIKNQLTTLGMNDDDTDDPRSGAYDYVAKNIPGTQTRRTGQDLDMATFNLARGNQLALGKSDNDALLAAEQAKGLGGSGRQRYQGADEGERAATSRLKLEVAGMSPAQRASWIQSLPPDEKQVVQEVLGSDGRAAASEQVVR